MVKFALYAHLKARPGKEAAVQKFLADALPVVQDEPGTRNWYAIRENDGNFSIFDTFDDEDARNAHLEGKVAAALMEKADELFAERPAIHKLDVIAAK
jgi:quinol monooxygenase YgiN